MVLKKLMIGNQYMKKFKECMYPDGCKENSLTTRMNKHHIVAKHQGGRNVECNYLHLCPNHHNKIYIEGSTGIHGSIIAGSIIVNEKLNSTVGSVLKYVDCDDGLTYMYYYNTKEKVIFNEANIK